MMFRSIILLSFSLFISPVLAASSYSGSIAFTKQCLSKNWIAKNDASFAADCVDMAFKGDLKDRQTLAWAFFTRANQLIEDSHGVSRSDRVPQWMAWATDDDTFKAEPTFEFTQKNRDDLVTVTEKKLLVAGVSNKDPDGANEESVRNAVSYDYITKTAMLNTKAGVLNYINNGNSVNMPVGSFEVKASWLKVPPSGAPAGALTFKFKSGTYWWRGMHIMVKMRPLSKKENLFYTKESSWFWTTFEFNNNPGVEHVRQNFISQRAPLSLQEKQAILSVGGIEGFGFEAYAPNGTQVRYTLDANGKTPVILGHSDMEDFAGAPNTAQPSYWRSFNASCHSCHATASINPETETYFPFSVPVGALTPQYYGPASKKDKKKGIQNNYLGDGFVPLDFMWPISFHAK